MSTIRGPLYRLKTNEYDLDNTRNPLHQQVDRSRRELKLLRNGIKIQREDAHFESSHSFHFMSKFMRSKQRESIFALRGDEALGQVIADWKQGGFELSNSTCDLRCHVTVHSRHSHQPEKSDSTISLGFIQAHTKVSAGPFVETFDRNVRTTEKLALFTLEICFQCDDSIYPRYCILGHPDIQERDRWFNAIQTIIDRKQEVQNGWHQYCSSNTVGEAVKTEQWMQLRTGSVGAQVNIKARRKARLQNGKVLQDVPIVFEKMSEDCDDWPMTRPDGGEYQQTTKVMDASRIVEALAELGLELSPKISKRMLDEVQRNPPCVDIPDKIDLKRFMLIFQSCRQEMLVSPSAEMKENLMRIMQDSKNPFLSLLSPSEQMYLIEGKDADGHNVCTCKSYAKDTVLVKQNDEGDSMFLIIEGKLSVVVSFGSGSATTQKEVAVLPTGAVMGEMSLVLGKPRSATCIVKSESASVAEIAKSAMIKLLQSRPSLARELEEIVYRRDVSNYVTAGKAGVHRAAASAEAMAAYRERGGGGGGQNLKSGAPAGPGESSGDLVVSRPPSRTRIQSRLTRSKVARPMSSPPYLAQRPATSAGPASWPPAADAAAAGGQRVKSGRWVKCKGVYIFLVD